MCTSKPPGGCRGLASRVFFFEKGGAGLTADAVVDRSGEFGVGGGFLGGWRVHE